jgi:hypothetical protein
VLRRIATVRALAGFSVELGFTDGTSRVVDLSPYLRGPVFEPIVRDATVFRAVRVDPKLGTIVWPNGADIDPDVLADRLAPA